MFRTRQAPSPTGYLHFGTARQMLFTKLLAMANNGTWYLRVDDTDRNRLQPDAVVNMLDAMQQLGLLADEGVTNQPTGKADVEPDDFYGVYQTGEFGPYIQSQRLGLYHEHAQQLIDKRLAYWSYLTEEEKEELMQIKKVTKRPVNYYKATVEKYGEESLFASVQDALKDPRKPALKFRLQRDETIECTDELLGKTSFDLRLEEDFNILKSDGYPTYHLAHLIDDKLMETSLVIRAQEWYPSLPKHVAMFRDYWGVEPKYIHLPFILGETGTKKMSKRDGNVNMKDWIDKGYLPEAVINYLAFLGWNPGTEKELYLDKNDFDIYANPELRGKTLSEIRSIRLQNLMNRLAAEFTFDKLQKAPARFSLDKLNWFNREYIKLMTVEEFNWRMAENKLAQSHPEKKFRRGEYAYLVDFKNQQVYGNPEDPQNQKITNGRDGLLYPIGGGADAGETPLQTLTREIREESMGQLEIDPQQAIPVATLNIPSGHTWEYDNGTWEGKQMNIWVYPTLPHQIEERTIQDGGTFVFKWVDLAEVIETNNYVTYPVWKHFCAVNNLELFQPTKLILTDYAASVLDKNRITSLWEKGTESNCVTNWQKPEQELVKWKKISIEESIANVTEIAQQIEKISIDLQPFQADFYNSIFTTTAEEKFTQLVAKWEEQLKLWLKENNKDIGSYLWPLRVTLSGAERSPSPFELLAILDIEEVKKRIEQVIG